jgi:hypothetical protein
MNRYPLASHGQDVPLVIKVVGNNSSLVVNDNDPSIVITFCNLDTFTREVYKTIRDADASRNRLFSSLVGGAGRAVIFVIDGELISRSDLQTVLGFISTLEADRYVYSVLFATAGGSADRSSLTLPTELVKNPSVILLLRDLALGFSLQRRRYGLERFSYKAIKHIWLLVLVPVLVGLASGIGEGFMTRQVPDQRFDGYLGVLNLYLIIVTSLSFVFLAVLVWLFYLETSRKYRQIK